MRGILQAVRWILLGCAAVIFLGMLLSMIQETPK